MFSYFYKSQFIKYQINIIISSYISLITILYFSYIFNLVLEKEKC